MVVNVENLANFLVVIGEGPNYGENMVVKLLDNTSQFGQWGWTIWKMHVLF